MYKNRLFVEPLNPHTNERIAELLEADELFTRQWPVNNGALADAVEVTERDLVKITNAKHQSDLDFNVYDKSPDQGKLCPIKVSVQSDRLNVLQVLNRRVQKKLVKMKLVHHSKIISESR